MFCVLVKVNNFNFSKFYLCLGVEWDIKEHKSHPPFLFQIFKTEIPFLKYTYQYRQFCFSLGDKCLWTHFWKTLQLMSQIQEFSASFTELADKSNISVLFHSFSLENTDLVEKHLKNLVDAIKSSNYLMLSFHLKFEVKKTYNFSSTSLSSICFGCTDICTTWDYRMSKRDSELSIIYLRYSMELADLSLTLEVPSATEWITIPW
jgi:hypothetical protein